MAMPDWRRIAVQLALAGGAYYRLTTAERDALDDAVWQDWDVEWPAAHTGAERPAALINDSTVEADGVVTELVVRPNFYHRRGVTYWAGRRVWDGNEPEPLGLRHARDARGVMWKRHAGFWVRHREGEPASRLPWRSLIARYGPVTGIIRVAAVPTRHIQEGS